MKKVATIQNGKNFSAVNVGKLSEIKDYVLQLSPEVAIPGKVFVGQDLGTTGCELSFQSLVPGQDSGFYTPIKPTRNFISFLKAKDNIK